MYRWLHDVNLLLLTVVLVTVAAPAAAAAQSLSNEERARLAPGVLEEWKAGAERLDVIVHLDAPPEAELRLAPRGVDHPKARMVVVRETSTRVIGELQDKLGPDDLVLDHMSPLRAEFAATVSPAGLEALLDHPAVRYVEEDVLWRISTRQGIDLIHADVLHDLGYTGEGTAIAIIDTGVDYNHPTLGGGPIPNGKVVYGLDTADFGGDPTDPNDCGGHGTAVASVAAGGGLIVGNYGGGVARDASILAYKATPSLSCGTFSVSDVVEAIDDAVIRRDQFNVVAINLSIGGALYEGPCDARSSSYTAAIDDATEAGIAVVAASGNEGDKARIASPGCSSNAISVASVYDDEEATARAVSYCGDDDCQTILCTDHGLPAKAVTCYSNTNTYLDVFAPSENLLVADAGAGFTGFGGTSGAAPYVSGAIAVHRIVWQSSSPQ